jgi:hypothetical protein
MITTTVSGGNFVVQQVTRDRIAVKSEPDEGNVLGLRETYITRDQVRDSLRPRVGDRLIVVRDGWQYFGKAKKIQDRLVMIKVDHSQVADQRTERLDDCHRIFSSEFD